MPSTSMAVVSPASISHITSITHFSSRSLVMGDVFDELLYLFLRHPFALAFHWAIFELFAVGRRRQQVNIEAEGSQKEDDEEQSVQDSGNELPFALDEEARVRFLGPLLLLFHEVRKHFQGLASPLFVRICNEIIENRMTLFCFLE